MKEATWVIKQSLNRAAVMIFQKQKLREYLQKQPPRGVFSKRCSENMQQIYGRTTMPKCDFTAKQLY